MSPSVHGDDDKHGGPEKELKTFKKILLNAAFPSVILQIYDWYLEPNAGYYFMQNACEPIHIQLNMDDSTVAVVNRTPHATPALSANAQVFTMDAHKLYNHTESVSLKSTGVKKLMSLSTLLKNAPNVSFVVLNLYDASGKQVSHNAYWLAPDTNYAELNTMKPAQLKINYGGLKQWNGDKTYNLQITDISNQIAFFVRPQLISNHGEVMPSYWSANYFTLAPHETINVSVGAPSNKVGKIITIMVSGWNVIKQQIRLKSN